MFVFWQKIWWNTQILLANGFLKIYNLKSWKKEKDHHLHIVKMLFEHFNLWRWSTMMHLPFLKKYIFRNVKSDSRSIHIYPHLVTRLLSYSLRISSNFPRDQSSVSSMFSPISGRDPSAGIGSWIPIGCIYRNCCSSSRLVDDRSCLLVGRKLVWKGKLRKNVWKEIRNLLRPHITIL